MLAFIQFLFSNSIETAREHISLPTPAIKSTSCTDVEANSETQPSEPPQTIPTRHPLAGIEELWPHKDYFLRFCNQNLVNSSADVRKIGLLTLTFIASTSSNGIDKFLNSKVSLP